MRRQISSALALTAAIALQLSLTQSVQAKPLDLFCSQSASQACSHYSQAGFATYSDCITFHEEFCAAQGGDGGCYYDPRIGQTICQ